MKLNSGIGLAGMWIGIGIACISINEGSATSAFAIAGCVATVFMSICGAFDN